MRLNARQVFYKEGAETTILLGIEDVTAVVAASLLALDARFGSGCVLRTASASISYSSALVFFGSRLGVAIVS
jgi:hypothetical protein